MATAEIRARPVLNDTVEYSKLLLVDMKPIGCGAFGDVYRAVHQDWGCQVAYKKLDARFIVDERRIKDLKNEAEIHRQLRHPNIVSMLGVVFEDNHYGLVLEYIVYGSLDKFLEDIKELTGRKFSMSWKMKAKISCNIFCAMAYLHNLSTPVIHGDLKMQNILLGEQLVAKISDFGLSKWKDYSRTHTHFGAIQGTPSHIPPEKWFDTTLPANEKFDVYSAGILMWEFFSEEKAFADCADMVMSLVMNHRRLPMSDIAADVPESVRCLVVACWHQLPIERPNFTALVSITRQLFSGQDAEIQKERKRILETFNRRSSTTPQFQHAHKLACYHQALADNIRRMDRITTALLQKKVLTQEEFEKISSISTDHDRTRLLIDVLSSSSNTVYRSFLDALIATDQPHLYQFLEDDAYTLNTEHKTTLIDNYTFLQENILVSGGTLLDRLFEVRVLDQQELDRIKSQVTDRDKTEQLLRLLLRTSHEQYQLFLQALSNVPQAFIAEKLQNRQGLTEGIGPVAESENTSSTSVPAALNSEGLQVAGTVIVTTGATETAAPSRHVTSQLSIILKNVLTIRKSRPHSVEVSTGMHGPTAGITKPAGNTGSTGDKNGTKTKPIKRSYSFLGPARPTVQHVVRCGKSLRGVARLGLWGHMFVVCENVPDIYVYDTQYFTLTRQLVIPDSLGARAIAACSFHNCLYVSTSKPWSIIRFDVANFHFAPTSLLLNGECHGLSVTNCYTLIAAIYDRKVIQEYSTNGQIIKEITLDANIECLNHCVQLANGNFVLCHEGSKMHRVCIVDSRGRIIDSTDERQVLASISSTVQSRYLLIKMIKSMSLIATITEFRC